ncbi:MAG TPA: hypothetical protein VG890_15540 [Puia sp.]|nr:hypothetical protein [Puia sp.]
MANDKSFRRTLLGWWHFFIYKPGGKNIYWEKIISSVVIILGFIAWFFYNERKLEKLRIERETFGRYTIGITTGSHKNIRGSRSVDYMFKVNDVTVTDSYTWSQPVIVKASRKTVAI